MRHRRTVETPRAVVRVAVVGLCALLWLGDRLAAFDIDERWSVGGVGAVVGQCQRAAGTDDPCGAAIAIQPTISYHPNDTHLAFAKLGFAAGNAVNDTTAFFTPPWAADLDDSVNNINGGSRDYLLTAWYRYSVRTGTTSRFAVVAGIIDGADYLDINRYSNDEYTQFMNSALVNGPNVFVPSYAPGLVLEWAARRVTLSAVYMHVGREDDTAFDFFGLQFAYHHDTPLGPGNYRLLLDSSGDDFAEPDGTGRARRQAMLVSCDQQLGDHLGVFVRIGVESDDPSIDYQSLYSGGVDIAGTSWGRPRDDIGIGIAYLSGGNGDLVRSEVFESYYRLVLQPHLAVTGDAQYMRDVSRSRPEVSGWVLGLRVATQF